MTYIGILRIPIAVTFCSVSVQQNRGERIIDAVLRLRLKGASRRRAIVPSCQRGYRCGQPVRILCSRTFSHSLGHQRTSQLRLNCRMSASPPISGHDRALVRRPLSANSGLMHRSKQHHHSITSSARPSTDGGTSTLSALAVLRFTTSSNLVGCSTGNSPGFAPLKILSTKAAARRERSRKSTP